MGNLSELIFLLKISSMEMLKHLSKYALISSGFLVFIGLNIVLILTYKILYCISPRAFEISKRLHTQSLAFIFFFSIWWFLLDLPQFKYQTFMVTISKSAIIFFAAFLVLDIINYVSFEFYLPPDRVKVPHIIRNFIRALYIIGIVLFVMGTIFHLDVRPFLTGSAILTAVIGLALQDTLGNLFSGLALHMSRPFDIGHWVKFGEIEGIVTKIDWRATTIKTRQEDYVSIPNSYLTKSELINFSAPTSLHGMFVEVGTKYEHPPNKVLGILSDTARKTEGVSKEISPEVYLVKYNDFSIDYKMKFFIRDYRYAPIIKSEVMERIWYNFRRNDLEIPFPIQDIYMKESKKNAIEPEDLVVILSSIDFLQDLKYEEVCDLAKKIKIVVYAKGEYIIRQGDMGDIFYILNKGIVEVIVADDNGEVFVRRKMYRGNFFGEISVLAGEPRTASIKAVTDVELLALTKEDFEILLKKYPHMVKVISEKIASRQRSNFEQQELLRVNGSEHHAKNEAQKKVESLSKHLFQKIVNFFSISKS